MRFENVSFPKKSILSNSEKKQTIGGFIDLPSCSEGYRVCHCGVGNIFCHPEQQECPRRPSGEYMCIDFGLSSW